MENNEIVRPFEEMVPMFGGELGTLGLQASTSYLMSATEDGYPVSAWVRSRRANDPTFDARAYEVHGRIQDYISRPRNYHYEHALKEAMGTTDFPLLFSDVLNKVLLTEYNYQQIDWRAYLSVGRVKDFREKHVYTITGGDGALDRVTELGEYKERRMAESTAKYRIQKYGNRMAFSFEMFFNDDLDAFQRTPQVLARGARRREDRFATGMFVDASGPHASLYKTNHANPDGTTYTNILTGNPPLGYASFQAGLDMLGSMVDENGEPINIGDELHLVIPRSYVTLAQQMFGGEKWEVTVEGRVVTTDNPFKGKVTVHVNPYITTLASTANGTTSWFIFVGGNGRPAVEIGFLAGHEQPELFIKTPDQQRVGGASSPLDGDFNTDMLQNKVRMFIGGGRVDPRSTVASNGSGT
jgi:hypothetical protein